jgi:hypothetical protein
VLALAGCLAALAAGTSQAATSSTFDWIELGLYRIESHHLDVPRENRAAALVTVAVYDAAARERVASARFAAAGAATRVLDYLFPGQAADLDRQAAGYDAADPAAFARGRAVGDAAVARARHDGSARRWNRVRPSGPGNWAPTPPHPAAPIEPEAGTWRAWNLARPDEFRPPPPPEPGTPAFTAGERTVYETSRSLTAAQVRLAHFWASMTGEWALIAAELIRRHHVPEVAAARVMAALLVAQEDATIACWDAKYAYWSVRPVTAIRRDLDPSWLPLIETPSWPSYVSAHATLSGAAAAVLGRFFPRDAPYLRDQAAAASRSRLYAGVHFPIDNQVGLALGRKVARVEVDRLGRLADLLVPAR